MFESRTVAHNDFNRTLYLLFSNFTRKTSNVPAVEPNNIIHNSNFEESDWYLKNWILFTNSFQLIHLYSRQLNKGD